MKHIVPLSLNMVLVGQTASLTFLIRPKQHNQLMGDINDVVTFALTEKFLVSLVGSLKHLAFPFNTVSTDDVHLASANIKKGDQYMRVIVGGVRF